MSYETDITWAAGLFEGEGCLTISGRKYPHARVYLRSTDEDVVRRFAAIIKVGQVRVDDSQQKYGYKRQWEWYTGKMDSVVTVIELLRPHLGTRRSARAQELLDHVAARKAKTS
jgi:hypothetical protein